MPTWKVGTTQDISFICPQNDPQIHTRHGGLYDKDDPSKMFVTAQSVEVNPVGVLIFRGKMIDKKEASVKELRENEHIVVLAFAPSSWKTLEECADPVEPVLTTSEGTNSKSKWQHSHKKG